VLELGVGPTAVEVEVRDGEPRAATVHQGPPRFGADIPREEAAGVLGLSDADLHPAFEPAVVGTGLDYAIIPLRARAALGRIALDMGRVAAFEEAYAEVYPCAFEADDAGAGIGTGTGDAGAGTAPDGAAIWVEARGLFPLCGIPEDPATGSAAGPLAAYFARAGVLPPGETRVVLQGAYVGRPSHLTVSVVGEGGRLEDVLVGGAVRPVLWGELTL
jgi:PhzF family phenazine biosynthesis protein